MLTIQRMGLTYEYDSPAHAYDAPWSPAFLAPRYQATNSKGTERDTETGNDDFGARYYSNRFGRWLSADWSAVPVPVPYANLTNPQTLNLYAKPRPPEEKKLPHRL